MNRNNLSAGGYAGRAWHVLVGVLHASRVRQARLFFRNNSHLVPERPVSGGDAAERLAAKYLRDMHVRKSLSRTRPGFLSGHFL
jgi:hypothetical protein